MTFLEAHFEAADDSLLIDTGPAACLCYALLCESIFRLTIFLMENFEKLLLDISNNFLPPIRNRNLICLMTGMEAVEV